MIEIEGSIARYITTWRSSGPRGAAGADSNVPGDDGTDGNSVAVIYTRSATTPTAPTGGTWNGSDYDPPNGWHESVPGGSDIVYTVFVMLSGSDKTNTGITYGPVIRLTGFDGADGLNPPGVGTQIAEAEFGFVADQNDVTITSTRASATDGLAWPRVYADITNLTGPTSGLATQDSSGITIPEAGIYSILLQYEFFIRSTATSQDTYGVLLHIEDSAGTLVEEYFVLQQSDYAFRDFYIATFTTPLLNLSAGSKVYPRIYYNGRAQTRSRDGTTGNLIYRTIVNPDNDNRIVVRRYTNAGSSGAGTGTPGSSIDIVYRRSSTVLTVPPTGGIALNGEIRTAPTDWSTSIPSGTDPIYTAIAHISGTNNIFYDEPVRWTGRDGDDGVKGNSLYAIWKNSMAPITTSPTGISIDANGVFALTDSWTRNPTNPTTGHLSYRQTYEVNFGTDPPTLTALGTPTRDGAGTPGPISTTPGPAGPGSYGSRDFFIRTATNSAPAAPNLGYTAQTQAWSGFGNWVNDTPPAAPGDGAYIWKLTAVYRSDQNGVTAIQGPVLFNPAQGTNAPRVQIQYADASSGPWGNYSASSIYFRTSEDGGTTWSGARRFRGVDGTDGQDGDDGNDGANGISWVRYYHVSTSNTIGTPNVDYDGTSFSGVTSGWVRTIPTTPAGANVFAADVSYREGTAGETITGVVLFGTVPGAVTPPPSTSSNVRLSYGLLNPAGNPVGTVQQTDQVALEVGGTHQFTINMVTTTVNGQYWYVTVPSGFSITLVTDNLEGDITNDWPLVSGRYRYPVRFAGSVGRYTFTVRRDS